MKAHLPFIFRLLLITSAVYISCPGSAQTILNHATEPGRILKLPRTELSELQSSGTPPRAEYIITQNWDQEAGDWKNFWQEEFLYTETGIIKENIYKLFEVDQLKLFRKQVRIYNERDVLQETHYYNGHEYTWIPDIILWRHTNENDQIIFSGELKWNPDFSRWDTIRAGRTVFLYDAHQLSEILNTKRLENGDWVPSYSTGYLYDEQGRISQRIEKIWNTFRKEFDFTSRVDYVYDEGNHWTGAISYTYSNNAWQRSTKVDQYEWFDFQNDKPFKYTFYNPGEEEDVWDPYVRYTFDYDPDTGVEIYCFAENYSGEDMSWTPGFRESSQLDEQNNPLLYTGETYIDGQWLHSMGMQWEYEWNDDQSKAMVTIKNYKIDSTGGVWVNQTRQIYFYKDQTGLATIPFEIGIKVYPNPSSGTLIITPGINTEGATLLLYNLSGQLVLQQQLSTLPTSISIGHLDDGVYFATFILGGQKHSLKLVKMTI